MKTATLYSWTIALLALFAGWMYYNLIYNSAFLV